MRFASCLPSLSSLAIGASLLVAAQPQEPEPAPREASRTVIVVRHAERADGGADRDPELSEVGRRRARELAGGLEHAGVQEILVTQFRRTQQTAEPLAASSGLTPRILAVGPGGVDAHVEALLAALEARPEAEVVLVVGHSNTVPAIVRALSGHPVPAMSEDEYGTLYVVSLPPRGAAGGRARVLRASWSTRST